MALPTLLVHHPRREVALAAAREAAAPGRLVAVAEDGARVERELRRLGPQVALLPAGDARLAALAREVLPGCHVLELGDGPGAVGAAVDAALDAAPSPAAVLVVEDALVNLEMLADVLGASGFRVLRATTAEEGLEAALLVRPELVLMDVYLPGMSGIEALRALRARPETAASPVVMLSAHGSEAAVREALEAGAADFVVKPFSPRGLIEKARAVLAGAPAAAPARS